jgi:heavy metal sensor kinase
VNNPLRRMPLSLRLAGLFTGVFLVALAVLAALVYWQVGHALLAATDQALVDAAAAIANELANDGVINFRDEDPQFGGLEAADELVQLLDGQGQVVQASEEVSAHHPLVDFEVAQSAIARDAGPMTLSKGNHDLRVLPVPVRDHRSVAMAIVAVELELAVKAQQALLTSFVPAGLAALLLAGATGWAVARRGLSPVDRMVAEAETIHAGDLQRRLPVPETADELARLGYTLNAMLTRLSQAIERERAFTADASHELRTPLAILRAEVELARNRTRDPRQRDALASALEEADRLAGLIDDLLVLARADADRLDHHGRVDLGDLAAIVVSRFAVLARQRAVRITVSGAAVIYGDARGLERVLANLIDNALRHTPPGGQINISIRPAHGGADVVVTDTGPGVGPDLLDRLFDRFTRADPARGRASGGAGLGLSIVAAVVAAHGGNVAAGNRNGSGLEVTIHLPGPTASQEPAVPARAQDQP